MTKLPSIWDGQICLVLRCMILEYQGTIKELKYKMFFDVIVSKKVLYLDTKGVFDKWYNNI